METREPLKENSVENVGATETNSQKTPKK